MIGTYTWMVLMPPSSGFTVRNPGMEPRITSSTGGNTSPHIMLAGPRRNSLVSVAVSLPNADMPNSPLVCWWSVPGDAAGELDERVVEVGLLGAQVAAPVVFPARRGHPRAEQTPPAAHLDVTAPAPHRGHLRQRGEQLVGQRRG